jgi:hypothetical protein
MTWNNLLNQTLKRFAALQKETPASFAGFEMMGKAAKASGALDENQRVHCLGHCHFDTLRKLHRVSHQIPATLRCHP